MKKTDSTKIFHIIKNKLIATRCRSDLADTLAEEIYCEMHNNKRFIIGYERLFVKNDSPVNKGFWDSYIFNVNFTCEFLYPDTGRKMTARFYFEGKWENMRLQTKGKFKNIKYSDSVEEQTVA